MTLFARFAVLAASVCTISFLCASSCASTEAKKNQTLPELTPEQVSAMTPDEVADYYAKRAAQRAKVRESEEEKAGKGFLSGLHSVEKRDRMGDVNNRLKDDASNAVFPWQSHDSHRSETLLGRQSSIYEW